MKEKRSVWELLSLEEKICLVAGGVKGYGYFITEALAEAGGTVITASRNKRRCQEVARTLGERGLKVKGEFLDITQEKSILDLREKILSTFGRIDVLVNTAVSRPMKSYNSPIQDWEKSMQVNATGVFLTIRIFAEPMIERKSGSIINISSIYGMVGPDFHIYEGLGMDNPPDYAFHKGGIINLTRYLATRFAPFNIRVNCVSPGGLFAGQKEEFLKRYNYKVPLGRMAKGEDIKGAIVFLASEASSYITGQNIVVDGGWSVW